MRLAHNQKQLVARDFLSLKWFVYLATFDTFIFKAQVQFSLKLMYKLFASTVSSDKGFHRSCDLLGEVRKHLLNFSWSLLVFVLEETVEGQSFPLLSVPLAIV